MKVRDLERLSAELKKVPNDKDTGKKVLHEYAAKKECVEMLDRVQDANNENCDHEAKI